MGLGIMDPTFAAGQTGVITPLDVVGFDVMGWNLAVLEPSSLSLFGVGMLVAAMRRRRNRLHVVRNVDHR